MAGPSPCKSATDECFGESRRSSVFHIRRDAPEKSRIIKTKDTNSYPGARFIRGRFHAAVFTDEAMVPEHTD
ncbi:MAG: hypothetical protein A3G18_07585 [Rhodospirillales bacterium RIFCSPLOWO2_12_FULL_58_28]|nr:MAG: hypothetical protein A3H92_05575 [Rhodospirillales bacterium RIFCSPLOWO2_02_FULL_58_16]OHC80026.1 MAG: hypothetical protein A3G18_07585 [Rhodospirillales bacterium RIFCSPLOWO2_12_FULL_58_28]